jgi:hypothetical protein
MKETSSTYGTGTGTYCVHNSMEHPVEEWLPILVMSNQRFFKIVCSRFPTNVPKKLNIFVIGTKFIVVSKRSLSVLKIFGPKEIDLFRFQFFFETTKSSVLF